MNPLPYTPKTTSPLAAISSATECYQLLESLDLLSVSRAFILEEFGSLGLSNTALNHLAVAVQRKLEAKGLSVEDCLGL